MSDSGTIMLLDIDGSLIHRLKNTVLLYNTVLHGAVDWVFDYSTSDNRYS